MQWVQLYEFSPQLLASVIEALRPVFSDYVIWLANDGDLIILAANGGRVPEPRASALANPRIAAVLERFHIHNLDDLQLHRVGSRDTLDPYFRAFGAEANSDYFPLIDLHAAKARFMRAQATSAVTLTETPVPVMDLFEPGHVPDPTRLTRREGYVGAKRRAYILQAQSAQQFVLTGDIKLLASLSSEFGGQITLLRAAMLDCRIAAPPSLLPMTLYDLARLINGFLPAEQAAAVWSRLDGSRCKSGWSPSTTRWLRLHAAVAERRPAAMADAALAILGADNELRADPKAYTLAVLMAGRILAGEPAAAAKAFQQYRTKLRPDPQWQPVFTLLSAHSLGPLRGGPIALR